MRGALRLLHGCWRTVGKTARLAVGLGDYETYCVHLRDRHPDATPMSREVYFRERMASRYAKGRSRCC